MIGMTEPRLKSLLEDLAAEAPPGRSIRTQPLLKQIRRRRARRKVTTGAATLSAVAVVLGGAVVTMQWINQPAAEDRQRKFVIECGERIRDAGELTGPLRMSAGFPAEVSLPDTGLLEGTVTFTNVSDKPVDGIRGMYPAMYLVKDGMVVTDPVWNRAVGISMNLEPGEHDTVKAYVSLQRCPSTDGIPWQERVADLEPGRYEMYAQETYIPEGHQSRADFIHVYGGPWRITLR